VGASDLNETSLPEIGDDVISVDETDDDCEELSVDDIVESEELSVSEDTSVLNTNHTPQSANDIQSVIDSANDGDTIIFDKYYVIKNTINVNKKLNFVGIGDDVTIDGNNKVRLFYVSNKDVTFKNITFKNAYYVADYYYNCGGGAIYFSSAGSVVNCNFISNSASSDINYHFSEGGAIRFGSGGSVVNCTFRGNSAFSDGGAIYFGSGGSVVNCSFISNSACSGTNTYHGDGGAIYFGSGGSAVNCSFVGNSAEGYGNAGAIRFGSGGSVVNCSFISNSASDSGGAVSGGSVVNCSFISNSASDSGGAVSGGSVVNCTFRGNSAKNGGAVSGGSVVNCSFISNSASSNGGAMNGGSVVNCSFISNSASSNGGAMNGGSAVNSTFEKNKAKDGGAIYGGSAVNSSFVGNSATNYGGAAYCNRHSFIGCDFINNTAKYAGATYQILAINCTFNNNYATERGGSMYNSLAVNSTYFDNHAKYGGAVYDTIVSDSIFENNLAERDGGAMNGKKATNCTFNNNHANNLGGAVYNAEISTNSKFNNNTADNGNDIDSVTYFEVQRTFSELNKLINSNDLPEVYLNQNYTFNLGSDYDLINGIPINRQVIIYGNGYTVDGGNVARIFTVTNPNVIFREIILINGKTDGNGGAINGVSTAINCTFRGNSANSNGGAMNGGSATNCSFISNSADKGGALYQCNPINCIFMSNSAGIGGGSIFSSSAPGGGAIYFGSGGSVINCSFVSNTISVSKGDARGGAIYFGSGGSAVNCTFTQNSASSNNNGANGGALYGGSAVNCSFESNSVGGNAYHIYGGAVSQCSVMNCSFYGNSAGRGGAMSGGSAINCTFVNNAGLFGGGAIYNGNAVKCIFIDNYGTEMSSSGGAMNGGTATNCTFINNTACKGSNDGNGGATAGTTAINCYFIGNYGCRSGGAMSGGSATNCTFEKNHASEGGAVSGTTVKNCSFIRNYALRGGASLDSNVFDSYFFNNHAAGDNGNGGGAMNGGSATNCTFVKNYFINGRSGGGAVSRATVINCSFIENYANNSNGYGLYGGAILNGNAINCSFIGNSAYYGGAVSGTTVENCSFIGNSARNYGGAMNGGSAVNCTFINNTVSGTGTNYCGGAVYCGIVENCTFINSSSFKSGGAIYLKECSNITINNCNFINCTSSNEAGGAIALDSVSDISISDCTFVNCSSAKEGAAVYWSGGNNLCISKSTFENCTSNNECSYFGFYENATDYAIVDCVFDVMPEDINITYDTILSVNDLSIAKGEEGILTVNLSNIFGMLSDKTVYFTVNGNNYTNVTNSEGIATLMVSSYLSESGIYSVCVGFEGDGLNNPASVNATVIIRYNPILNVNDLSIVLYEDGILTANLSDARGPLDNKNITFTILGNDYINTTDSNGLTSLNVKDYLTGANTYTVYLSFEGDNYDNPTSESANVVINKFNPSMTVNNLSVVQGENGILTVNLSDSRGPLANKTINFNVNGKRRTNNTNEEGIATIDIRDDLTDVDEYTVNVSFDGDEQDNPISVNSTVVIKYNSILAVNDLSIRLGDDGIIIANLSTNDGAQSGKVISFKINGIVYANTTSSKGIATFNVKNYLTSSGIYTIPISFEGDKFNGPVSASSNVIIRYDSTLNVDGISVYITQDAVLTAKLSDSRGVLKNKNIIFTINGNSNTSTTNSNGIATLNVKEYLNKAMTYTFDISFEGDNENNPVSTNATVTVNKYAPSINVQGISVYIGTDGILSATLRDARGVLKNKVLKFTINGNDYTNTTDSNGVARFNVKNYLTQANTYPVTVSFAGDDYDNPVSANVNVVIKKYSPTLTVNSLSIHKGEDGIITAKLSDSRGALVNKKITFTIQGNTYTNTTDSQGITSINVKDYLTDSGIYVVGVSFAGDDWDNSVSRNSNVVVRYDSVLSFDNVSMALGEDTSLIVSLSDSRGALKNKKIVFTVNNNKRNIYTNNYGLAALPLQSLLASSGEYVINVSFEGDNENNPISANASVIVRWDVDLSVEEVYIYKGEEGNLSVILSDQRGILANRNLTFTVNNENHTIQSDVEGVATIKITDYISSLGTYGIVISFDGDMYNNPCSISSNVIIRQYDSILDVNNMSIVFGDDENLIARLSNIRGPLQYQYVSLTVGSTKDTKLTDSNGEVSFNIKKYLTQIGEYTVKVGYDGDENNKETSVDVNIRINTYIGNLTIAQKGKYYNDTVLEVKLVDAYTNQPKSGVAELVFSTGDTYPAQIDSNGILTYDCSQFTPGNYSVTARVVSDPYADINIVKLNFTISSLVGVINVTKIDYTKTLRITLFNPENGDVYRNVKIDLQFSPNGHLDYTTTDSNGVAMYNMPFTPGTYSVIATVAGDYKQFKPGELKNIVISDKETTKVTFDDEVIIFDYGKSGSTTVHVEGGSVDIENITVMNQNANISIDANNKITVSGLDAGKYKLHIITTPDSAHDSVIAICNITVNRVFSSISFDNNIAFDYLQSGETTVNVTGGSIGNISIDENPQGALIDSTGNKINVSGLDAGTYTLRVSTLPDKNHKSVEGTAYIIVNKIDSKVNVTKYVVFNYGQSGYASVEVEGGSVDENNIKIIGYENIFPQLVGNIIIVSGLDAKNYTLSVTSTPDKNHYPSTGYATITVNKIDSKLSLIKPIVFNYGGSDYTSVYMEGCTLDVDNISVIGHDEAKITFDGNVISVSNLSCGNYTLNAISTPDANHNSVNATVNITVNRVSSEIKSYNSIVFSYLGTGSTFITVDGGILSDEKMEIVGQSNAVVRYANNRITVSNLNPGSYTLRVESIPDGNHNVDVKYISVTVNKASAKIVAFKKTVALKKGSWTVKVLDSNNKPIKNIKVTLKVYTGKKFKTVTLTTNSNGEATYKTKKLSKGNHKVVVSIEHAGYKANPVTSSIKVIKQKKLTFKVSKKKNFDSSSVNFRVFHKGKAVNGIKFKLLIYTGKKVVKTIKLKSTTAKKKKGIVGYTTNELSVGTHKVKLVPASIKYSGSKKSKIKLTKSQVSKPAVSSKISG
jgi:hypothetical protein